jgi:methyl-accepting chemotaxis protein
MSTPATPSTPPASGLSLMSLLRHFSVRMRMIGAIAAVLCLLAGVGAAGTAGLLRMKTVNTEFAERIVPEANLLAELRTAMGNVRRFEKDMVLSYEQPAKAAEYHERWQETLKLAAGLMDRLQALADDEQGRVVLDGMRQRLTAYASGAAPVIRSLLAEAYDGAGVANRLLDGAKAEVRASEALLEELGRLVAADAQAANERAEAAMSLAWWIFGAALGLAVVTVVPLTLANMHSICRPIEQARALADRIAGGDLSSRIEVQGRDEGAALQESLLRMQQALAGMVGTVRESASSIGVASTEVASGNADLSSRTEQTASNLQQAASSLEQITGTVAQTADSARTASQLATGASEAARRGGAVVGNVVTTMEEISSRSRKIADIIGTIDGIAFQTNILALNAAVEAARAGEQGRGFAVVAGEVRTLAQRSAEAAREIKALIQASVEKVQAGSALVQQAGSSMDEIVGSVQRVTDVIGEISAATTEQTAGLRQINEAVAHLDQMTQQNAALVEQSAAAAESLAEQSQRLAQAVAAFRTEPGTAPPPMLPAAMPPTARTLAADAVDRARSGPAARSRGVATRADAPARATARPQEHASLAAAGDEWESF